VTGVQTCALPIFRKKRTPRSTNTYLELEGEIDKGSK